MSIFDGLLDQVKNAVIDHTSDGKQNVDRDSLLGTITNLFGQHAANHENNVRPASEDRYGDPADSDRGNSRRNVRPASEDPYGDPANQ